MIAVVFTRSHTVGSAYIRYRTAGLWSHVGLLTPEGTVIDSTAFHGVRERSFDEFVEKCSEYRIVYLFPAANWDNVCLHARSQIGKKYDYTALFGIWARVRWDDEGSWFCSELIAWAVNQDIPVFRVELVKTLVPQYLWVLAPAG